MNARCLLVRIACWFSAAAFGLLPAVVLAATAVIQGRVVDDRGRPVAGAVVSAYDSEDVRRPADFASPPTGADGAYRLVVAPGTYWLVAVARRGGGPGVGPLQLGDRHSGEPLRLAVRPDAVKEHDFTVLDLQSAARRYAKKNEDLVTVAGMVVDGRNRPVAGAYVLADRRPRIRDFPQYLSGWTGADGRFLLYLQPGEYHLAAATAWPPPRGMALPLAVDCRSPRTGLRLPLAAVTTPVRQRGQDLPAGGGQKGPAR